MRIAVLVKQVPRFESLALGPDGRLVREGLGLEMNPYCRRAVSQGVGLAGRTGGRCTVITLGPPVAEDVLREAVAWGADVGVLITDPAFAGSDTLATARALAAALTLLGPFDLVLAGRNSVDADTGQVGPEVAELLGLAFAGGVRAMELKPSTVAAHLELDDGWADIEVDLPALLTCAERLCEPAKVDPSGRARVPDNRIRRLSAADLGPGPWGHAGSPTRVGQIRVLEAGRGRLVLSGTVAEQVSRAVGYLADAGALTGGRPGERGAAPSVPDDWPRGERAIVVLVEPDRERVARELLGGAARLAAAVNGRVIAVVSAQPEPAEVSAGGWPEPSVAGSWGADEVVTVAGVPAVEDWARLIGDWCESGPAAFGPARPGRSTSVGPAVLPWAVLAPGTMWGRELASRLAARLGAGLTGDAVDLAVDQDRLVGWKPAFGGQLVVAITARSAVQLVTVRSGMLAVPAIRARRPVPVTRLVGAPSGRIRVLAGGRDDDLDRLAMAGAVVGVGTGVGLEEYAALQPLLDVLGAELAATRKVTDRGWQPRSRQIGLTGRSISPRLYIAIGLSGKFNHLVGVRGAGKILAINQDRSAPLFQAADIGIVADWREAVPLLAELAARVAGVGAQG